MTSEFNERLPISPAEKAQIWIVGTREQVAHLIDEFYVSDELRPIASSLRRSCQLRLQRANI